MAKLALKIRGKMEALKERLGRIYEVTVREGVYKGG